MRRWRRRRKRLVAEGGGEGGGGMEGGAGMCPDVAGCVVNRGDMAVIQNCPMTGQDERQDTTKDS